LKGKRERKGKVEGEKKGKVEREKGKEVERLKGKVVESILLDLRGWNCKLFCFIFEYGPYPTAYCHYVRPNRGIRHTDAGG
jgi:hypothetical protein